MDNNLKQLRGHLTQQQVASQVGITQEHYSYMENNKRLPSLVVAIRLADYFRVALDDLFVRERKATKHRRAK